jgi:hypothetical protein
MSESEDDSLFVNPLLSVNKKAGAKAAKESDDEEDAKEGDGFSSADEADEKLL